MAAVQAAESIELAALSDLFAAAATPDVAVRQVGPATLFLVAGGPPLVCNRMVFGQPDASLTEGELEEVMQWTERADIPWVVSARPDLDPALLQRLAARRFRPGYAWMKFERNAEPPPDVPTALRIARAGEADGAALSAVLESSFGAGLLPTLASALPSRPGWHCFLAWHEDRPVAAAGCFVQGDAAWFGMAATAADYRRWGAHQALLAARIRAAATAGARRLYVETGERVAGRPEQSYRNLLRMGFRELYRRENLLCPDFHDRAAGWATESRARCAQIG